MFISKNWTETVWIYGGIFTASLLKVDVPSSSQSIGFESESAGAEMDDKVELQQIFGPSDLLSGEEFGGHKVFEIFVVGDDVDRRSRTFEVVSPNFEGFKDHE